MTSLPDLVFRAGPSDDGHDELRYAIRSQTTHLPHKAAWIAGVIPPWWIGPTIPVPHSGSKYEHAYAVLRAILAHPDLTPEAVVSDDDMFLLQPLDAMPAYHRGRLADAEMRGRHKAKAWTLALAPDAHCRELHIPTLIHRAQLAATLDRAPRGNRPRLLWRSLDGPADTVHPDVKIHDVAQHPRADWASTNVHSWAGAGGEHIRATFIQPSPWET